MEKDIVSTKKEFRNPFPATGKVFKYEMLSMSRIFVPLFLALIGMSLVIGLSVNTDFFIKGKSLASDEPNVFMMIFYMLFTILCTVSAVVLLVVIEKRFKKTMLGDEGYLNLTFPVTIGEHLWGRYFANIVWCLAYGLTMLIALALITIKGWKYISYAEIVKFCDSFRENTGMSLFNGILIALSNILSFFMLICTFAYFTHSLINIFGTKKKLLELLVFAVFFIIFVNIYRLIIYRPLLVRPIERTIADGPLFDMDYDEIKQIFFWISVLYNLIWATLFSLGTRLILNNKMNLE